MRRTSLPPELIAKVSLPLDAANIAFARRYPGEPRRRQPVHTVYGGAHLFRAETAQKLGTAAIRAFEEYAADPSILASALRLPDVEDAPRAPDPIASFNAAFDDNPRDR